MQPDRRGNGAGSAAEAMIAVDGLTRYYGEFPALRGVSFRAFKGEILGFLGPNGAGKTTAMRIITGYMPPTSGHAVVAGHDVTTDSKGVRRNVGYLPESTPLYLDMTVSEYLDYMARLRDVDDRRPAVERAMAMTQVDHRADDLIGHLSKGYRQRVGIAQALVHDPPVLILDEPTIGLDPRQIIEVRQLINGLRGEHTVVLSTHILPEAQQVCDRVLIVNRGRVVAEDRPENLAAGVGGEQVRLAVPTDVDQSAVESALRRVPGVDTVSSEEPGIFMVAGVTGSAPRPELAKAIVAGGWPLLELTPLNVTLEDIFLELTSEEPAETGAEDTGEEDL